MVECRMAKWKNVGRKEGIVCVKGLHRDGGGNNGYKKKKEKGVVRINLCVRIADKYNPPSIRH